jgi:hypothetical protein
MTTGLLGAYFDKLLAAVMSPVVRGVIVEADTLVTTNADRLFDILRQYGHQRFPLLPEHSDVRWEDCSLYNGPKTCVNPISYPRDQRSMDYMHAHLMWTVDSKAFLIDLLLKCSPGSVGGGISCEHDEMALNQALWKAGATHQLCLMDPYYDWFMKAWEDMDLEAIRQTRSFYDTMGFLFIHGAKDVSVATAVLDRIETMRGKPWLVDRGGWSNDSDSIYVRSDGCIM